METILIIIFILGYVFIALEHTVRIDKAASALLLGGLCWTLLAFSGNTFFPTLSEFDVTHAIGHNLAEHLSDISGILFFLLGAMTIVEMIDAHGGFRVITDRISTVNRVTLLWVIGVLTFFLSSVLDNLTTAIVISALLKKLMKDKNDLWTFGGVVIIAANAGGAWSPIGDVTTIMLWIGGQVTAANLVKMLLLPSLACLLVPMGILSFMLKGKFERPDDDTVAANAALDHPSADRERTMMFAFGIAGLLFVPVFKTLTHLPPYLGMLISLGALWVFNEFMHRSKEDRQRKSLSVSHIIGKVDVPTVFFFLGILLAVSALQTAGILTQLAALLDEKVGNVYLITTAIGILSAVVDNVPLVAGAMGMYPITTFPQDDIFWELLAYTAGTGGSMLIIGSAAGVAVMGIMRIDFVWYMKRMTLLAASGYFAGIIVFYLLKMI
ncbi:MAG: sodium:proton antiporter NhaD [Flavobacteriales bacterium]|nr:sodium:proton antiporter NhaD [Flavobacteriales bacterium]